MENLGTQLGKAVFGVNANGEFCKLINGNGYTTVEIFGANGRVQRFADSERASIMSFLHTPASQYNAQGGTFVPGVDPNRRQDWSDGFFGNGGGSSSGGTTEGIVPPVTGDGGGSSSGQTPSGQTPSGQIPSGQTPSGQIPVNPNYSQQFQELQNSLRDNKNYFQNRLNDIDGRIANITQKMTEQGADIETLKRQYNELMAERAQVQTNFNQIESRLQHIDDSIVAFNDKFQNVYGRMEKMDKIIMNNRRKITDIEAQLVELRKLPEQNKLAIEMLEKQKAALEKGVENLTGRMQTLESSMGTLGQKVEGLTGKVDGVVDDVAKMGDKVNGIADDVAKHGAEIKNIHGRNAEVDAILHQQKGKINELTGKVDDVVGKVDGVADDVAKIKKVGKWALIGLAAAAVIGGTIAIVKHFKNKKAEEAAGGTENPVVTTPGGEPTVTPPEGGEDPIVTPPGGGDEPVVIPPEGGDDTVVTPVVDYNYTVKVGDCVWNIAEAVLTKELDRTPTPQEIAVRSEVIIKNNHLEGHYTTHSMILPNTQLDIKGIEKGDDFWNKAKADLESEGVEEPTDKQIEERCNKNLLKEGSKKLDTAA